MPDKDGFRTPIEDIRDSFNTGTTVQKVLVIVALVLAFGLPLLMVALP